MTALQTRAATLTGILNHALDSPLREVRAIGVGFDPLDAVLDGGLRRGDLMVLGGVPGVGKTVTALQWARNVALEGGGAVFACYEHDERAILHRLLMLEVAELSRPGERDPSIRRTMSAVRSGLLPLGEAFESIPALEEARGMVVGYSDRLFVKRASGTHTGLDQLNDLLGGLPVHPSVLVVDYLQKVAVHNNRDDRVAIVTEGLKDIAMAQGIAIIAVAATDRRGLSTRRARTHHLRGSASVAYEADTIVMMNDKFSAVSKRHSTFDPVRAEGFRRQVVFSLEKNRSGLPSADMEFTKDFAHFRFEPKGGFVKERLVDDWLISE